MTDSPRPPARQPWPMWPIVLAIIVSLAGYTYLRLAFAKQQKPHEPYADSQRRADHAKLQAAGWHWSEAAFEPLADLPSGTATIRATSAQSESVTALRNASHENWQLPIQYTTIAAAPHTTAAAGYPIVFRATLDQARAQLVGFDLYRKDTELIAIPRWAPLATTATRDPTVAGRLVVPAATLPPGRFTITLPALAQSSSWELEVAPVAE